MAGPGYNEDLLIGQSTPFGITASGTLACNAPSPAAQVLNAFRHHGERDRTSGGTRDMRWVLNAFRHHGERDGLGPMQALRGIHVCSTPFGITASGTSLISRRMAVFFQCSTPFGITASGTVQRREPISSPSSAQRLSASRRAGPHAGHLVREDAPPLCSTPFGITASGTEGYHARGPIAQGVLNAFRHHGERDGARIQRDAAGRVVLNAFRHHGERDLPSSGMAMAPVSVSTGRPRLVHLTG